LKEDLSNINMKQIFLMGLLFVFLNSGLNQLILYWNSASADYVNGILVMLTGDLTGTYFVLSVMKLLTQKVGIPENSKE
jgi:hypothetical protein